MSLVMAGQISDLQKRLKAAQLMNVYEARHDGHYLGGLSVIVAENEVQAMELLHKALDEHNLKREHARIVRRLNTDEPRCFVLDDGDY